MDLVSRVEKFIMEERLLREGDIVVVAVSGGPDSAALLHILFLLSGKWKWSLVAAHFNHQFRGEESDREARFVEQWAAALGIPCEVGSADVPAYIAVSGKNAQDAAREKRYEFLQNVAEKYGAQAIALGHHADDQAETVLMRLIQGTGPSGLAGIPLRRVEKKVERIRPLLRIYKSEIIDYCKSHGLSYCVDSSNLSRKYFRNKVRLDLVPLLEKFNPHLAASLNRLAETVRAEDEYLTGVVQQHFEQWVTIRDHACHFSREPFLRLHLALQRRLIKLILNYLVRERENANFSIIENVRTAIVQDRTPNLTLDLGEGLKLNREYESVSIQRAQPVAADFEYIIEDFDRKWYISEARAAIVFAVEQAGCRRLQRPQTDSGIALSGKTEYTASFDLDQLAMPLSVRSRKPGDRMRLLGLNATKKVKNIFIDEKIPPSRRNAIPIFVDAEERILWIPGVRRSAYALVTEHTRNVLHAKVIVENGLAGDNLHTSK
mgnify:CR=1 FL=1